MSCVVGMRLSGHAEPEDLRAERYPQRSVSDSGASRSLNCGPFHYAVRLHIDTDEVLTLTVQ